MQKRIAVCGAPVVGKTTLLAALAQETGMERPAFKGGEYENMVWLHIKQPDRRVSLLTIAGSFNHPQSTALPRLLTNVDAVFYVIAAVPPTYDQVLEKEGIPAKREIQQFFWQKYTTHAESVGSLWTSIP